MKTRILKDPWCDFDNSFRNFFGLEVVNLISQGKGFDSDKPG